MQKAIKWQIVGFPQNSNIKYEIEQKGYIFYFTDITNDILSTIMSLLRPTAWKLTMKYVSWCAGFLLFDGSHQHVIRVFVKCISCMAKLADVLITDVKKF